MRHLNHQIHLLILVIIFVISGVASAQTGSISGVVKTKDTGAPLAGANVVIVGTSIGGASDAKGKYTIANVPSGDYKLRATFIGYQQSTQQVEVAAGETAVADFALIETGLFGQAVVVSASRRSEKLTEAPASIAIIDAAALEHDGALTCGEALSHAKGVDTYRTGIDGVGINARGFMSAFNYRTQLMVDGINAIAPAYGLSLNNLLVAPRDDIERIEAVLGPSSALYGPNAHNGLVNVITKHPRENSGTSVTLGGGQNSVVIGRFRHARAMSRRLAYKLSGEYMQAKDWMKNDLVAIDNNNLRYFEEPDPDVKNLRADGGIYWRLGSDAEIAAFGGYSEMTSTSANNVGRTQFNGFAYSFQALRFHSPHFFVQAYRTSNGFGHFYSIDNRVGAQVSAANAGRPISKEEAARRVMLIDESKRYNFEVQYNTTFSGFRAVTGANHEYSRPITQGTFLTDTSGTKLHLRQTGVYGQVERELGARWKFIVAGRYDTHDNYDSQFSPRTAVVYKTPNSGAFRLTFNQAFQAPSISQQEIFTLAGFDARTGLPVRLRGNGHGFALSNGVVIPSLEPEINTTFELGYNGLVLRKFSIDANIYHSRYKNFASPLTAIGISGNKPPAIPLPTVVSQGGVVLPSRPEVVLTYLNFGKVNITGFDLGLNYQLSRHAGVWLNYSYVNPNGLGDKVNDLNRDGVVDPGELSFNAPENKYSFGVVLQDVLKKGTHAALSMRYVAEYDFVSGRHRATATGRGTGVFQFTDRGPLGGFNSVDLNLSWRLDNGVQLNLSVANLLDEPMREMVGSPSIRRLAIAEIKYSF
ncbi:MAG: TonB-dependent receptor [bacterium]